MRSARDIALDQTLAEAAAFPIAYYVPRPTAKKFHLDTHRTRFLFGGKQATKSYTQVAEVVMSITGIESLYTPGACAKFRKPPVHWRHWCEDLTRVAVGILYPIYRKLIPDALLDRRRGRDFPGYNKTENKLYLTNGSTVQFLSYEMAQMKGESATLDGVAFDEPPPEKIYEAQYMRILLRAGHMIGAMTLDERRASHPIHWIDRRIRRKGDGKHVAWWRVETMENIKAMMRDAPTKQDADAIWAAYEDAYATMSAEERAVVFEGRGGWAVGLVFPDFDDSIHAAYDKLGPKEVVELAKKGWGFIRGALDPGLDDPTAMIWAYTQGKHPIPSLQLAEGDHLIYREYKTRGLNYRQHAERLAYLCKGEPIQMVLGGIDLWERDKNGGPPEGIAFFKAFQKLGIPLRKCNRNKRLGHNRLSDWLKMREQPPWPRLRMLKGHVTECVDEAYAYSWKAPHKKTGKRPDETVDANDHVMDDLRYWAMSFPADRRREMPKRFKALPRHPVTGMPMSNFVNIKNLSMALER